MQRNDSQKITLSYSNEIKVGNGRADYLHVGFSESISIAEIKALFKKIKAIDHNRGESEFSWPYHVKRENNRNERLRRAGVRDVQLLDPFSEETYLPEDAEGIEEDPRHCYIALNFKLHRKTGNQHYSFYESLYYLLQQLNLSADISVELDPSCQQIFEELNNKIESFSTMEEGTLDNILESDRNNINGKVTIAPQADEKKHYENDGLSEEQLAKRLQQDAEEAAATQALLALLAAEAEGLVIDGEGGFEQDPTISNSKELARKYAIQFLERSNAELKKLILQLKQLEAVNDFDKISKQTEMINQFIQNILEISAEINNACEVSQRDIPENVTDAEGFIIQGQTNIATQMSYYLEQSVLFSHVTDFALYYELDKLLPLLNPNEVKVEVEEAEKGKEKEKEKEKNVSEKSAGVYTDSSVDGRELFKNLTQPSLDGANISRKSTAQGNAIIDKGVFAEIVNSYESNSIWSKFWFFSSTRSGTMRGLQTLLNRKASQITQADIESAIRQDNDSERRLGLFQNRPRSVQNTSDTDRVILELRNKMGK